MDIEACLKELSADVAELKAQQALRSVLSRYAVAVDDKHADALRTLFTSDIRVEIPAWSVDAQGIEAVMVFYAEYWAKFANPRRYFANEDYKVTGDLAQCFMYWHVTQERNDQSVLGWGTYAWRFRREAGAWRIEGVVISIRAMTTLAAGWATAHQFTDA